MFLVQRLCVSMARCPCDTVPRWQRPVDAKLRRIAAARTQIRTLLSLSWIADNAALHGDVEPDIFARDAAFSRHSGAPQRFWSAQRK
jgi:hypothetical protein